MIEMKHPITTCLWFDGQAREAAEFYCTVFSHAKITAVNPLVVTFEINGSRLMGLNGGPKYKFTEAVSFVVHCDTQEEMDYCWERLTEGGTENMCGWLKDKFGVSWQIVPTILGDLMREPEIAARVMKIFMNMRKPDIQSLQKA